MLSCEAHVQCGRFLKRREVPAPLTHQVIHPEDVQLSRPFGFERNDRHIWLTYHFQVFQLLYAGLKLLCSLHAVLSEYLFVQSTRTVISQIDVRSTALDRFSCILAGMFCSV